MQAESLEVLEKASLAPAQARAIVRAIEIEIEIAGAKDTLATKRDLDVLRADLRTEIAKLGGECADPLCAGAAAYSAATFKPRIKDPARRQKARWSPRAQGVAIREPPAP
jgi:hypothetical protein